MRAVVLVTGATSRQGGATARRLLAEGFRVRALTRNVETPTARALAALGAEVVTGDLNDRASVDAALRGAGGVFSVQTFIGKGADEVGQGVRLADAAKAASVGHFVYSSVGAAERGRHVGHFGAKWRIEEHLRGLGLRTTILRPAYFMDNLWDKTLAPPVNWGVLRTILGAPTTMQMLASDDIGVFAAHAFAAPDRFVGRAIEIAGDTVNYAGAVAAYRAAFSKKPPHAPLAMTLVRFYNKDLYDMYDWFRESRFTADIAALRREYPALKTLAQYFADKAAAERRR